MPKRTAQASSPADAPGSPASAAREPATGGNVIIAGTDASLLELVRDALKDRHRLWRTEDVTQAADLLLAAPASVLLLDLAITGSESARVIERLHEQFPGSPVVVTGHRDEEAALSSLISSGAVFRFLHKPLSADRVRTFVEAGIRRVAEQPPPPPRPAQPPEPPPAPRAEPLREAEPPEPRSGRGKLILAGAALLAAVAAAVLLGDAPWRDWLERSAGPPRTAATADDAAPARPPPDPAVESRLREGELALVEARYTEPAGDNAIEHFRAVLALDPGNEAALSGLGRSADLLLVEADLALLDGNLAAAATALDAARAASPKHPQLAEFSARLGQERAKLVAPNRPAAAAPRPAPADPRPAAAAQTSREAQFERAMAGARDAIARNQPADADAWITRAAGLGVDQDAVDRARAQLDSLRAATERAERARLLALANQRIAQGLLIQPDGDSARHYLDLLRASDPSFAGVDDTAELLGERLVDEARRLAAAGRPVDASRALDAAAGLAGPDRLRAARAEIAAPARPAAVAGVQPESSLQRIAYTPPAYPPRAAARGLEGWVDIEFTVGADGTVRDAAVKAAEPAGTFDRAALNAVERWRYEPRLINGAAVDTRVTARVRFQITD